MRNIRRYILAFMLVSPLMAMAQQERMDSCRALVSVKTNLLLDAAYVPQYGMAPIWNVAMEYYPSHGHYTWGLSFDSPWSKRSSEHKYFMARNYQVEIRRYFQGDGEFKGWYVQGYAHAVKYGIGFNADKGWQGEGFGGGLGAGFVTPLSRKGRWKLEFQLQLGYLWTKYDKYVYGCPVEGNDDGKYYYDWSLDASLFKKRQYRYTWIGPTRVGVTLSYDLIHRSAKKKKGGKQHG